MFLILNIKLGKHMIVTQLPENHIYFLQNRPWLT